MMEINMKLGLGEGKGYYFSANYGENLYTRGQDTDNHKATRTMIYW
jgi:hypothetical protein